MCRKRGHGFILYLSPLKLRFCGLWVGFGWICFEFWVDFQLIFSQIQIMILSVFCQFFRIFPEFRLYFQYLTSWIFITCQFLKKMLKEYSSLFCNLQNLLIFLQEKRAYWSVTQPMPFPANISQLCLTIIRPMWWWTAAPSTLDFGTQRDKKITTDWGHFPIPRQ